MKRLYFHAIILSFVILVGITIAQQIIVKAGYITNADLFAEINTAKWGGIIGYSTSIPKESNAPVMHVSILANTIDLISIAGTQPNDGKHYFAALPQIDGVIDANYTINVLQIENITAADLEENGLFNATNFPVFHPSYYSWSDNPKNTFCCKNTTIIIYGKPFLAYVVRLEKDIKYYLLKYRINSTFAVPLFVVNISTYTCYNSSTCNFEMMLPAGKTYNIYLLPLEPAYEITTYIDGVKTTSIPKTARAYNLTVFVKDIYNNYAPVPNATVAVFEDNGNNIFFPLSPLNTISRAITYGKTDENGRIEFVIAPTATQTEAESGNYRIGVGLLIGDKIVRVTYLTLVDPVLSEGKKYLSSPTLFDNSKATVVSMIQIEDSVYYWAKQGKAIKYTVTVYTNGSYVIYNASDPIPTPYTSATLKTGAVNLITVIYTDGVTQLPGYVIPEEREGYLIFDPTQNPPVIGYRNHTHLIEKIPTGNSFVIVPTKYGEADSKVEIKVYDSAENLKAVIPFTIDKDTSIPSSALSYLNDEMKSKIVKTLQVLSTLYYAYW